MYDSPFHAHTLPHAHYDHTPLRTLTGLIFILALLLIGAILGFGVAPQKNCTKKIFMTQIITMV